MPTAEIGRWAFVIPDEWTLKDAGIDVSYMESPDGKCGMYAKTVLSKPAEDSPEAFAKYIQQVHQNGFAQDPQANWSVMESSVEAAGDLVRSRLDLFDHDSSYRVLSLVLCNAEYALQVTVHDYECKDYVGTKSAFAGIEQSMRLAAGAP